jgi:outer membrane protein TolC
VAAAQATLAASVASFVEIVGHSPGSLKYPKLAKLPPNLDGAVATAERINPQVLAAAFVAEAAQNDVGVARAGLLPSVSLQASALAQSPDLQHSANEETYTILGVVTIPLYEAGRVYSAVRQAKQIASQRRIEIIEVQRAVRDTVVTAWNALDSARQVIVSAKAQVSANELALEGVKQEYLVGSRTTLDVLDAEQELLLSRETLVVAERDQVVAAYQLIASTGRLTADDLDLPVKLYDPVENYRKVRNKWFGTHANTVD